MASERDLARFDWERELVGVAWTEGARSAAHNLGSSARLVALALATRAHGGTAVIEEQFAPSLTDLAMMTGLDRRTVARQMQVLAAAGWIERTPPTVHRARAEKATNAYRLTLPTSGTTPLVGSGTTPLGSGTTPLALGAPVHMTRGMVPLNTTKTTDTTAAREENSTMGRANDPDPLDDAAALFSSTHPGREGEALRAALALMAKQGTPVAHPVRFFATWPHERLASIKLGALSDADAHVKPHCGRCDGPRTRRVEDEQGNLRYDSRGQVIRCACWSPRAEATA